MSVKASTFISAYYPNTLMEQFCLSIHPDLELGPVCVNWFRQATKHCTELIINVKAPSMYFWTTVKNFIFPESHTELMSPKIPIRIHPNRLTMQDCQSLFLDIVNDYVLRAPRYAAESTTNAMLWQVLFSLVGIMTLGSFLLEVVYTYNRYRQSHQEKAYSAEDPLTAEKRLQVAAKRSLNMAKVELRQLQVEPMQQPEELLAPDGTRVMAIKLFSKYELLDNILSYSVQCTARLHRISEQNEKKTKSDFKTETISKALRFLGNARKLRLLLIFEDVPSSPEQNKEITKARPTSPPKASQIPNKRKRFPLLKEGNVAALKKTSGVESIGSGSPRYLVGDSASPRSSLGSKKLCPESSSASPKKKTPRNCSRNSPTFGSKS